MSQLTSINPEEVIATAIDYVYELMDGKPEVIDGKTLVKPKCLKEAMEGPFKNQFEEAMERELYELDSNNTWKMVFCPKDRTPITCRWVFDIKRNKDNMVERFKARLVVQGFKQIEGVDFQKTFSSTAQMRTFRTLVALSVKFGLKITQYDISNAFVRADIDKEIYMTFPPGFRPDDATPGHCFLLLKGLYGLKQASRLWNQLLTKIFKQAGLDVCQSEPGVFHVKSDKFDVETLCLINLYVDDYNICTRNEFLRKKIEDALFKVFETKSIGKLELFLGIVVETNDDMSEAILHQKPYHERLIESTGFSKSNTTKTPAESSIKLSVHDCPENGERHDYGKWHFMSVEGSLMYSAFGTRPDICQRVCQLARYGQNPGNAHIKAQKHVIKYLKGTIDKGIRFCRPPGNDMKVEILGFVDSDWTGCTDTRRSTVGWSVHICGGPISWVTVEEDFGPELM